MLPSASAYKPGPKAPPAPRKAGTLSLAFGNSRRMTGGTSKQIRQSGLKLTARERLRQEIPGAFCPKGYPRPLAVGVHFAVSERIGWPMKEVRKILGKHCSSIAYLKAVAWKHSERHDIDGNPVEHVSDEDRQHASDLQAERGGPAKHGKKRPQREVSQ